MPSMTRIAAAVPYTPADTVVTTAAPLIVTWHMLDAP